MLKDLKNYIPFYKRNLAIAIPVVFSQAGQMTVQLVDNAMVGHVGTSELAAASFAGSLFINGLVFGMGFSFGLTPLVGNYFGQKKHKEAGMLFQNSIVLNLLLSLLLMLVMYGLSFYLDRFHQTDEVVKLALPYYRVQVFSMLPFLLFFSFKQFTEGIANTKVAMYITLSANIVNILLNYILINGKFGFPAFGLMGAGYATLAARTMMPILFIVVFLKKKEFKRYFGYFELSSFRKAQLLRLVKIGVPIATQSMIEFMAFSLGSIMMGWLGEVPLAAHQIILGLASLTFMLSNGVASGTTIRVSHQLGAGNYKEMRMAAFASLHIVLTFMLLTALSFIVFRYKLPLIFSEDPAVISVAANLLIVAAIFQLSDGLQVVSLASLRGLSDVRTPMIYAGICYIGLSLPVSYIFTFVLNVGPSGIWYGYFVGLSVAGLLFVYRFHRKSKKMIRQSFVSSKK